jgi:hypothetical protein
VYVSGRYAYVASYGNNSLVTFDIGGASFNAGLADAFEAGNLQVRNDILAQGNLQITGGITAGVGGIFSSGPLSVSVASSTQTNALSAYFQGNVGIGTTSPATKLTVTGAICASQGAGVATAACSTTAGTITANVFNTASADLAERYGVLDTSIDVGDIVALDYLNSVTVKKAKKTDALFGIISTKPGFILGQTNLDDEHTRPVALAGRVPVKVSMENGMISIGDNITISSQSGIGMKSTNPQDQVIGVALEKATQEGTVLVFVKSSITANINSVISSSSPINLSTSSIMALFGSSTPSESTGFMAAVQTAFASMTEWIGQKITAVYGYFEHLTVGSREKPAGITLFDKVTGNPYCVQVSNGALVNLAGDCATLEATTTPEVPSGDVTIISGDENSTSPIVENIASSTESTTSTSTDSVATETPVDDTTITPASTTTPVVEETPTESTTPVVQEETPTEDVVVITSDTPVVSQASN